MSNSLENQTSKRRNVGEVDACGGETHHGALSRRAVEQYTAKNGRHEDRAEYGVERNFEGRVYSADPSRIGDCSIAASFD